MKDKAKAKPVTVNKETIFDVIRGTLIAVISALLGVLILAIVIKFTGIGDSVILPINQALKILSVLIGCVVGIKDKTKGAIKGGIIGLLFTAIAIFVFLIINKTLEANSINAIDFIAGIAAGVVSGIIAVNFKKK
jgi:putative membrane protein, TIGR04086 family/integral membrane protein, TIGR04097 family